LPKEHTIFNELDKIALNSRNPLVVKRSAPNFASIIS